MLYLGKNITSPRDALQPVKVEKVYQATINPKGKVAAQLSRLQQIRAIDPKQYRRMKTRLPYLVCARFHPMVRRKENFMQTKRFLLDIDHISDYDLNQSTLRHKLKMDPHVEMFFSSPSGDGLKVLFRLKDKITDSSYYAQFYKAFCLQFNQKYQLGPALDTKTNDVSRCCFVSFDADAFYNPEAKPIDGEKILPKDQFLAFDHVNEQVKQAEKENRKERKKAQVSPNAPNDVLPEGVLNEIKKKVGQKVRKPKPKNYIQPEELQILIAEIEPVIAQVGAKLEWTKPIEYGRVLHVKAEKHWAELNIFYGKRGVSVVRTTKTGSQKALVDLMYKLLTNYFENR